MNTSLKSLCEGKNKNSKNIIMIVYIDCYCCFLG